MKTKSTSKDLKIFDHHPTWATETWAFWPKTCSWAAKTCFYGSSRTICKNFFRNNLLFTTFSVFQSTFSGLSGQFFWQVCQNWILGVRRSVRRPIKNFRQRCRNCVLHVQWNFLLEMCFLKTSVFTTFWTVSSSFSAFRQKTPAVISKLAATCPQKHFEEKEMLRNIWTFRSSRTRRTRSWAFWWISFQQGCQNCLFRLKLNKLGNFFSKICCNFSSFFDFE